MAQNRIAEYGCEIIRRNYVYLLENLLAQDITAHLFQYGVIDHDDLEEISLKEENRGRKAGVKILLTKLQCRAGDWYNPFIKTLEENGYNYVAQTLKATEQRNHNVGLNNNSNHHNNSISLNDGVGRHDGNIYNFHGNYTHVAVNITRDTDDLQDELAGNSNNFYSEFNQVGVHNNITQDHKNFKGLTDEVHELDQRVKKNKDDIDDLRDNVEELSQLSSRNLEKQIINGGREQPIRIGIQGPSWRDVMEPLTVDPNITVGELEELLNERLKRTDVFIFCIEMGKGNKRPWFELKTHKTLKFHNVKDGHTIHINYRNTGRSC